MTEPLLRVTNSTTDEEVFRLTEYPYTGSRTYFIKKL